MCRVCLTLREQWRGGRQRHSVPVSMAFYRYQKGICAGIVFCGVSLARSVHRDLRERSFLGACVIQLSSARVPKRKRTWREAHCRKRSRMRIFQRLGGAYLSACGRALRRCEKSVWLWEASECLRNAVHKRCASHSLVSAYLSGDTSNLRSWAKRYSLLVLVAQRRACGVGRELPFSRMLQGRVTVAGCREGRDKEHRTHVTLHWCMGGVQDAGVGF